MTHCSVAEYCIAGIIALLISSDKAFGVHLEPFKSITLLSPSMEIIQICRGG